MKTEKSEELLKYIHKELAKQSLNKDDAAFLAYKLCEYEMRFGDDGNTISTLHTAFQHIIEVHGFHKLLNERIQYAVRLASDNSLLIYEEMLKLFYLCDEINALLLLGFKCSQIEQDRLVAALSERFTHERKMAKTVAMQNVESWKSQWWWYADNSI